MPSDIVKGISKFTKPETRYFQLSHFISQQHAITMPLFSWDQNLFLARLYVLGYKNSGSLSSQILLTSSTPLSYIRDRIPPSIGNPPLVRANGLHGVWRKMFNRVSDTIMALDWETTRNANELLFS